MFSFTGENTCHDLYCHASFGPAVTTPIFISISIAHTQILWLYLLYLPCADKNLSPDSDIITWWSA